MSTLNNPSPIKAFNVFWNLPHMTNRFFVGPDKCYAASIGSADLHCKIENSSKIMRIVMQIVMQKLRFEN